MKSLSEFIKECIEVEENYINESCSLSINFDGLDDAEDILKQLADMDGAEVTENTVELSCDAGAESLKKVYDILKKYSDKQRNSQHRSSDEQYAQKTVKFENKVNELNNMIQELEKPKEDEKDDEKKEEE